MVHRWRHRVGGEW